MSLFRRAGPAAALALTLATAPACLESEITRALVEPEAPLKLTAPLDIPLVVTGTLGEFRPGNFHYGLDFSTERRVGLPVYAAADGHLARIAYMRYGAGYALWIAHGPRRSTRYLHLDRFDETLLAAPELASLAERIRKREEFDLFPGAGRVPIRQGQRIGRSGESGAGLPHLHFELYDGAASLDPQDYGVMAPDPKTPTLRSLRLLPAAPESRINGAHAPLDIPLVPDPAARSPGHARFKPRTPLQLRISGPIWIAADLYDQAGISRLGIKSGTLALDDREIFKIRFDRLARVAAHWHLAVYDQIYSRIGSDTRYLYYFFERRPELLPFIEAQDQGRVLLAPGARGVITLSVQDVPGQTASISLPLLGDAERHPPVSTATPNVFFGSDASLKSADGKFRVEIPERAVFEEARMQVAPYAGRLALPRGLVQAGPAYQLTPEFQDLIAEVRGELDIAPKPRVHLYRIRGGAIARPTDETNCAADQFCFRSRLAGVFVPLEDASPPQWTRRDPPRYKPGFRLFLYPADLGSGLDFESARVSIDGKPALAEYDPDRRRLEVYYPDEIYRPGTHRLQADIRDYAGNAAPTLNYTYTVSAR